MSSFTRLLIIPIILLILSSFSILKPEALISTTFNDSEKIKFIGIAGGIIGLLLSISIIIKWLTKNIGFVIDKSGITDGSNASYNGLVEWNDITKVEAKKVGPIKLIILHSNNPEKYINKAKKTSIRQLRKNLSFYGSPLLIVSSRLKIKYDDLFTLINSEFRKLKQTIPQK